MISDWACARDQAVKELLLLYSRLVIILDLTYYPSQGCSTLFQSPGGRATQFIKGFSFQFQQILQQDNDHHIFRPALGHEEGGSCFYT